MKSIISVIALLGAVSAWSLVSSKSGRRSFTITVPPASTTTSNTIKISGSVKPMSGPGASSNGQTGAGAGAGASTYTTLDAVGNTFIEVFPSGVKTFTVTRSTMTPKTSAKTTAAAVTHSSSSAPPPSSSASPQSATPSPTSSSAAFAAPTAIPGQFLGAMGLVGLVALL
ncbi:hypothetical protein LTR53_008090 [Teratosphaeriaceae sp. CCFEE 6253]|nr:hypothetical protein LTR53_008090 [Teratosphaeriaceae sp. CCFEE 6253]